MIQAMRNWNLLLLLLAVLPLGAAAQTREVSATTLYYADAGQSPKEAKQLAVDKARIEAIGKEFGTLITQDAYNQMSEKGDYFLQLSTAELKGEWVKDLTPPEVKLVDVDRSDIFIYEAKVKGLARAVKNEAVDFETLMLRNVADKQSADTYFKEGDKFYLYFKAPANGYLAAFLIDEQQDVYQLLPYENMANGLLEVKHDKEYYFFSTRHDTQYAHEDGMVVTCGSDPFELDRIYVIFSPKPFVKPVTGGTEAIQDGELLLPPKLSLKDFTSWMAKVYGRDKHMSRKVMRIKISKK